MQCFLGDPDPEHLYLEMHCLALAIAKKTLDENRFRNAQKTRDGPAPNFQIVDRVYFKKQVTWKWDLKWRAGYRIVHMEHNRPHLNTENPATGKIRSCNVNDVIHEPPVKLWNTDTQFGRVGKFINHPANLPTITLNNNKKTFHLKRDHQSLLS